MKKLIAFFSSVVGTLLLLVIGYSFFFPVHPADAELAAPIISPVHIVLPSATSLPTVSISASPTTITQGQGTTITWASANASACTASNALGTASLGTSGSLLEVPAYAESYTYTITCSGSGGTSNPASAEVTVTVPVAALQLSSPSLSYSGAVGSSQDETVINSGPSGSVLTWTATSDVNWLFVSPSSNTSGMGGGGDEEVTVAVSPSGLSAGTYTGTIRFSGISVVDNSTVVPQTLTVTYDVPAPAVSSVAPTVTLSASLTSTTVGQPTTLTWSSTNAATCGANGFSSSLFPATSGTTQFSANTPGTYHLTVTCTNGDYSGQASVTVTVDASVVTSPILKPGPVSPVPVIPLPLQPVLVPAPTVTIGGKASLVTNSTSAFIILEWSSQNATSCVASGAWSGTQPLSGESTQIPASIGTSTYTITCSGAGGSDSASAIVTASPSVLSSTPKAKVGLLPLRVCPTLGCNGPIKKVPIGRGFTPLASSLLPPIDLQVIGTTASSISLSWQEPASSTLMASYYGIYRDNIEAATTTETSFTDTGLVASTTYTYTVAAYNASGSVSSPSASVSGTTDQLTLISSSTACIGQYTPILAEIQQATSTQAVEALAEGAGLQIASSTQSDSFDDLDSLTTVTITAPCSTTVLASVTEYDDVFQVNTSSSAATPIDLKEMSATSSIQLSWKEFPAEYVTDYVIYRSPQDTTTSTPSTDFEQIGTSLTTSFIDDTALANTKYNYEVAASDAWGDASAPSAPLNDVSYSTPFSLAPPALSPVQGLSASVSGNTVNLSWQANQPNNDNELYYIYRTTTSGCAATSTMFEGIANWNEYWQTLTQFTDAYVPPGTYYYCVADAPDGSGLPGASAPVDASTVSTPLAVTVTQTLGTPPPPQIPSVSGYTLAPAIGYSSVTTSTISLAWTDDQTQVVAGEVTGQALESPYTGTAGFDIYRNGVFVGTSATTSYMDTGLTPSTTYHYSVAAYTKNGGTSSKTPTTVLGFIPAGDITTLTQSEIPPQMQGLAATVSGNAVQLVWGDTTDTVMVFRAPTPDCEATSTDFVAETNNPYFIDDDLPLSTYYYCIAEYDDVQVWDNGYPATVDLDYPNVGSESYALLGPVSAPIQATVAAPSSLPPSVPTGLTVTATTLSSISLSWSPSREPSEYAGGSLAGYRIYRNGVEIATTKGTSFTDTDLIEYTPYLYTVAAYDDQGTVSGQSINVGGTPLPSGNNDTSSGPDSVNITTSITSPLSFIPALESMPTIIGRFISAVIGVPTAYAQTVPVVGNNTGGPASCAIAGSNGQAYVLVTAGGMLDGVSSNYSFSITQNSNSTPWSSAVALDVINAFANINALGGVQGTPAGSMPTANAIGAVLDYINIQSEPVGAIGLSWDVDTLQAMGTTYNNSCLATAIVNNLVANSNNGAPDMSNSTYMTNIFMHEIGHCLGLDHVDDPNNIMNPAVPEGASTFNAAQIQFLQDVAAGKTIQVDPTTCKTKCDPNYAWSQTANRCVLVNTLCNPAVFPNSVWNQVVQSCLQCPADTYANTNTNTCVPISHDAWVSYELPPTTCSFSTDGNGEPNTYSCTDGIDCNCQTNGLVTCINGSGDDIAAPPDACQGGCPDGEIQATGGDDSGCVANCSLNPFDPSCGQAMCGSSDLALSDVGSCVAAACVGDPTGQDCADYCDANPGAPGCPDSDYCQQNPLDPTCFCASYPDDPSCTGESGNAGSSGDNGDTSAANTTQPFANSSLNTETALAISSSSGMTSVIVRTQNTSISNQTAIINQALGELLNELAAFLKRL